MKKSENKTEKITMRCTKKEKRSIENKAKKRKKSVSQFLVEAAMYDPVTLNEHKRIIAKNMVECQEVINDIRLYACERDDQGMLEKVNLLEERMKELWQS